MAKKKTSVMLPGGIAGLVHQVQKGGAEPARKDNDNDSPAAAKPAETSKEESAAHTAAASATHATGSSNGASAAESRHADSAAQRPADEPELVAEQEAAAPAPRRRPGRPANEKASITPTEKAARDYKILVDKGSDNWDLFLALGRDYKTRDSKLATIYIDADLKKVLDRLKTASDVKLPTAAILSSIVARFIFDHKEKINEVIFGERLI